MATKFIYDSTGGVVKTMHVEDITNPLSGFTVQTSQDITSLIETNKIERELQEDARFITGKDVTFRKVASVGADVMLRAYYENWDENDLKKFLNDTEQAAKYRVWQGRL